MDRCISTFGTGGLWFRNKKVEIRINYKTPVHTMEGKKENSIIISSSKPILYMESSFNKDENKTQVVGIHIK